MIIRRSMTCSFRGAPALLAGAFAMGSLPATAAAAQKLPKPTGYVVERLPPPLVELHWLGLALWQWLGIVLLLFVGWGLGRLAAGLLIPVLARLLRRTSTAWDDLLLAQLSGPVRAGLAVLAVRALLPFLALAPKPSALAGEVLRFALLLVVFWALARLINVAGEAVQRSDWAVDRPATRTLVPLGSRIAQLALLALAVVALLATLGYPVASLLAGLGIGGLALALAAQKTVENLFGAFSLGVDQPFREGDFVRIDDTLGTVEEIGLRSTRIRTLDRTLVSIPNGKLSEMRIESFSARDRIRLACTLGLVYDTSAGQMREVLEGFERVLRNHPRIFPDTVVVRFKEFGASSLDIEIMAWFLTQNFGEFQLFRQQVLLGFMDVVERAKTSFAFPTRTVHLIGEPGGPSESNGERKEDRARASA